MVAAAQSILQTSTQIEIAKASQVIPHLAEAATVDRDWLSNEDLIWPFVGVGTFYKEQGAYEQALLWYEQCLSIAKERLGEEMREIKEGWTRANKRNQYSIAVSNSSNSEVASTGLSTINMILRNRYRISQVRYDYRVRYNDAAVALQALERCLGISQTQTLKQPSSPEVGQTSIFQKIWQLLRALFGGGAPENTQSVPNPGNLEQPEGQVRLKSAFYIERPPVEDDCYKEILKPGALIRIKAPRQMGKTSLLTRILDYRTQHGCQTAYLNLQSANVESLTTLDKFLQWFCGSVAQELNLQDKLTEYWQGVLGSKDKCTNYFQRYLLTAIEKPIVLGLDEVDQVFQYPQVAAEFFALLRAWHETANNREIWKKLRLVIVHSTEVYIPLNINQSPFNIGLPIELPEFNPSQVQDLVRRHDLNWSEEEIQQLMEMLGGHPYLVRKALHEIARNQIKLSQLLQIAPTKQGMYTDHLRRHLSNLREDGNLVTAMRQVIKATPPIRIEADLAFKLRSMGLVKFQGNNVIPAYELYRQYFLEHLE
ncbi:MAG: AAA-like domain-containing protein [Stigonema ocellatum SAG 48.90 = DSM 106950]|nr:AAA-like domain-containing protein [Stigonema ocellatum SAG 48.90 = DSM 106950]